MEAGCRWGEGVETGDITVKLLNDNRSFYFCIQEGHELCYVAFIKFSLGVNDPASAYIIWKSPKDFRCEDSTIVVKFLPQGS
jgi:hypothetical protein